LRCLYPTEADHRQLRCAGSTFIDVRRHGVHEKKKKFLVGHIGVVREVTRRVNLHAAEEASGGRVLGGGRWTAEEAAEEVRHSLWTVERLVPVEGKGVTSRPPNHHTQTNYPQRSFHMLPFVVADII
jgi:hypothetical protein